MYLPPSWSFSWVQIPHSVQAGSMGLHILLNCNGLDDLLAVGEYRAHGAGRWLIVGGDVALYKIDLSIADWMVDGFSHDVDSGCTRIWLSFPGCNSGRCLLKRGNSRANTRSLKRTHRTVKWSLLHCTSFNLSLQIKPFIWRINGIKLTLLRRNTEICKVPIMHGSCHCQGVGIYFLMLGAKWVAIL